MAAEGIATHGREGRSFFVLDPATGALVVETDLRSKFGNALRREAHCLQFRLDFRQPGPYLAEFRLQGRRAASQPAGEINRYLLELAINGHVKSPNTGRMSQYFTHRPTGAMAGCIKCWQSEKFIWIAGA